MKELLEVATGCFIDEIAGADGKRIGCESRNEMGMIIENDERREEMARSAMTKAGARMPTSRPVQRIKVGGTANRRRVRGTRSTSFGHAPRFRGYGKRRWKYNTGGQVAAERDALLCV